MSYETSVIWVIRARAEVKMSPVITVNTSELSKYTSPVSTVI